MDSVTQKQKPHAVCIPYPAQSHIKAMLKLAQILHSRGIQITFVNTEYNHKRLLKSGGLDSLYALPDFRFETIPDGLPSSDSDAPQNVVALCKSVHYDLLSPFLELLEKIPPLTCIVSDGFMSTFTPQAGKRLGIPVILSWTIAACALMGFIHIPTLREKGFTPLKDSSYLTNGYMDTVVDWIPGMKGIRLKDLPGAVRTIDPNDPIFEYCMEVALKSTKASASIIHTFDELESDILRFLSSMLPQVYTIGPLQLLFDQFSKDDQHLTLVGYSLWKEEPLCLEWLDSRKPSSVLYVNFGSIATMSSEKVVEFALGLASSGHDFLWIIRPDLVMGESAILPSELSEVIKERGFIASWCPQEQVLNHSSIGSFLTHCGWNSTIESLSAGVPMICLPFFGDQPTNCRYMCNEWEVGLEIDGNFKSENVEKVIRELMEGDKGKKMKNKAMEWKEKAEKATRANGSSYKNMNMLMNKFFSH